ncbi:MAG TPA: MOSC domain-containing protein [Dehalococcoidia bacterium]|nr:MOSC domain-containing protein [Dehalococcoidia bacterium]
MVGRVVGLYTAACAGAPITGQTVVEVRPGVGIVGDRYARGLGYWSDPKWPDQELTLVEAEVAEDLDIDAGALRRNVVTHGVRLDGLIGVRFRIGDAVIEGVRPCDPCRHLESLTRPGIARALAGRGGLRARILTGGRLHVGDPLIVLALSEP